MPAMSRNTILRGYPSLVRQHGADPLALLRTVHIAPADLASLDRWLSVESIAELLERTATQTGRPDFGLLLAESSSLSRLGPVGLVARDEPTVRDALNLLIGHMDLYDEGLRVTISKVHELTVMRVDLVVDTPAHQMRQIVEMKVGACVQIISSLLGGEWQPLSVNLAYTVPADADTHRRVLGPNVEFSQEFNSILLYTSDLERANTLAEPHMRPYTRELLRTVEPRSLTVIDRSRQLIEALLPTGRCSLEHLARKMDMQPRTLQRHLAEDGRSFSKLLDEVRAGQARRYVANGNRSLTEVAELLGFCSIGAFSRWFRSRFGTSASTWRAIDHAAPATSAEHQTAAAGPILT